MDQKISKMEKNWEFARNERNFVKSTANGDRRLSPLENARPKWSAPYSEDTSGDLFPYRTADTSSPAYRDGVQTTVTHVDNAESHAAKYVILWYFF